MWETLGAERFCKMVEVSAEVGLGEEEIELDLRLSIGGSFRRPVKPPRTDLKPVVGFRIPSDQNDGKQQKKRWMMTRECDEEAEEQQRGGMSKRDRVSSCCGGGGGGDGDGDGDGCVVQNVVGFNNGFAFPCWAPIGNNEKRNVVAAMAAPTCSRGFQPFLAHQSNGGALEHNYDDRDRVDASYMCSSSLVLEQQSSSHEGGGSSDSRSHSVHSLAEPIQFNSTSKEENMRSQAEQSASSRHAGSEQHKVEKRSNILKEMQPKITCRPTELKEEATMNSKTVPIEKPLSNDNSSNGSMKESKADMGKPPKPVSLISSFPQMPYVSATGNGPNGKTVNGFLYKYTESEVSIVCVCHGSTFSPSEFVQHAGGTDISHPLRNITVIPSAFG